MAHFAKLNPDTNEVIFVTVGRDEDNGKEAELSARTGDIYKQTSYNTAGGVHALGGTPFRFNYAGIGYTFDPTKGTDGAFIPPKPFESWVLSDETCLWEAPIPYPADGLAYEWDETLGDWVEIQEPSA